jgi:hypothetical protein
MSEHEHDTEEMKAVTDDTYAPPYVWLEYIKDNSRGRVDLPANEAVDFIDKYSGSWQGYRIIDQATDRVLIQSEYKTGDEPATN